MPSIAECAKKLKLEKNIVTEIIRDYKKTTDEVQAVQNFLQVNQSELDDIRTQLKAQGIDLSPRNISVKTYTPEELAKRPKQMSELTPDLAVFEDDTLRKWGPLFGQNYAKLVGTVKNRMPSFFNPDKPDAAAINPVTGLPERTGNNILDASDSNEKIKQWLDTFLNEQKDVFNKLTGGKLSDQKVSEAAAADLGTRSFTENVAKALNYQKGQALNAADVFALDMLLTQAKKYFEDFARKAVDPKATIEDQLNFQAYRNIYGQLGLIKKAGAAEVARSLRANRFSPTVAAAQGRILARQGKVIDPVTGKHMDAKKLTEQNLLIEQYRATLPPGDKRVEDTFLLNLASKGSTGDMIKEAWFNAMLSNPTTAEINMIGNQLTQSMDMAERVLAIGTKDPTLLQYLRFKDFARDFGEAMKVGARVFDTEVPSDPKTLVEMETHRAIPSWTYKDGEWRQAGIGEGGIGGRQVRIPGRFLVGADEFYKLIHTRSYIRHQGIMALHDAEKAAGKRMLRKDREAFLKQFVDNPTPEVMETAREYARKLTFTDDPGQFVNFLTKAVDNHLNPGDVPLMRVVLPFIRTPANILRYTADFSPIGFTRRYKEDIKAGGIRAQQARMRQVMGGTMMTAAAVLAGNGYITGAAPTDPAEREVWQKNNAAWSAKIGTTQVPINRFDPAASLLVFGASIPQLLKDINDPLRETAFLEGFAQTLSDAVLDKTWFQGVQNLFDAINDPGRFGDTFLRGIARTAVPSVVAGASRAYDPRATKPMVLMDVINDRIRFSKGEAIPTDVDIFGFDKEYEVAGSPKGSEGFLSAVNRFLNPIKVKSETTDPVAREVQDLGIRISAPLKKFKDHAELNQAQYHTLKKARGQYIYNSIKHAQSLDVWKNMQPAMKREVIKDFVRQASEFGEFALYQTWPELVVDSHRIENTKRYKEAFAPVKGDVKVGPSFERGPIKKLFE